MPLLPYCIVEAGLQLSVSPRGVQGAAVEQVCDAGLCCFYSRVGSLPPDASSVKQAALEFHAVVSSVFNQAAVIPVRFPTLVADLNELTAHLGSRAAEYREALQRLRGLVQMEIRISTSAQETTAGSGTQYLRNRQQRTAGLEEAASNIRAQMQSILADWRERETSKGWRCYALIARSDVMKFQGMVRSLEAPVGLQLAVSGPWPATEFISAEPQ